MVALEDILFSQPSNNYEKLKVMSDWTMDLLFKPDVAMIKRFVSEKESGNFESISDNNIVRKQDNDNIEKVTSK